MVKKIVKGTAVYELINNDIATMCAHTSYDKAAGGINDNLAKLLDLKNTKKLENGYVVVGELEREMSIDDFAVLVGETLDTHGLRYTDTDKMIKSLEGVIFKVPEYGEPNNWVTADEYLSGNVREKLKIAEQFAKEDSSFNINVEKLKEVIPKDLTASEIGIKLGSTWIPPEIIREFIFELLDTPSYNRWDIHVKYSNITAEWYIDGKSNDRNNVKAYTTYGTSRINAYKIIEQTLNLKDVKIFDTFIDDEGRKQRVLNRKETAIACSKQDAIKEASYSLGLMQLNLSL